jgi:cysteinyl-tRNA synthetase
VVEAEENRAAEQEASRLAPPEIEALVAERQQAREQRNWPEADRLRQALLEKGWAVKDTPSGPEINRR